MAIIPCLFVAMLSFGAEEAPNDKAAKYLEALKRRPSGGYLFDRFFNSWLDTGTVGGLEEFLSEENDRQLLLGYFFAKQGDDEKAAAVFEKALANDPGNAEAWLEKAKIDARMLDFTKALADLENAGAANPKTELEIEIGKLRGRLLSRSGKNAEALKAWADLAKAHAEDDELQEDLVDLQLAEGLVEEAVKTMTALVEETDDAYLKITRRLQLGDILQRAGKREKAIEEYDASLNAAGRDTWLEREVLAQIEQVFRREDDIAGLRDHFATLEKTETGRVSLMKRRASVLAELDEADEAMAVFEEILKLTPGDRENREAFVALLARLEKFEEAATQLKALADFFPEDEELLAQLAVRQKEADQSDAARDSVLAYLEKSDGGEYAYFRAARMLEQFDQDEEAAKIYEKLIAEFPESIAAKETRAAFLYRTDKKEEAVEIWKKIAKEGTDQDAMRAARTLISRNEAESGFEILKSRAEDFGNDFSFLGQLVNAGMRVKKHEEVLPFSEKRLALADSASDLNDAMRQVLSILDTLEKSAEKLAELEKKPVENRLLTEACLLSEMLERNSRFEEAEAVLKPLVEAAEPLAMAQLVRQFQSRNEWGKAAETQLKVVTAPDGLDTSNVQGLVNFYKKALNYEAALKWIEEWKKLSPGATQPWAEHSGVLVEDGKSDEAIQVMRSAVQRFEDDSTLRGQLANLYQREDKMADAERIYWTLYEESEDISQKLGWVGNLAGVAENQGKLEKLIEQFEERKRTNRTSVIPLLALAEIYRRDDDYEKRREMMMEVTRMRPEDVQLLRQIARIEEQEGDWERAKETLKLALPLDKTSDTKSRIAELELRYGDEEAGYREIEALAGGAGMDADAVLGMADTMVIRSGWERASEFLERHADRFPDDYRIAYLRALAFAESGNVETAQEILLGLLEWEHEINAKPASSRMQVFVGSFDKDNEWAPEGLTELTDWMGHAYYVYRFRQTLRSGQVNYSRFSGKSAVGAIVGVPGSVDAARGWAQVLLLGLAQSMDEEELASLQAGMEGRGIKEAEILLRLPFSEQYYNNNIEFPEDLLDEFPDHLELFALAVLHQQRDLQRNQGATAVSVELMERCYEKLKAAEFPELAFAAATYAASTGSEEGQGLLKKALEEVRPKAGEKATSHLSYVVSVVAGGTSVFETRTPVLDDELRRELVKMLIDWREIALADEDTKKRMNSFGSFSPWSAYAVLMMDGENYDAFADELDAELSRFENMRANPRGVSGTPRAASLSAQISWINDRRALIRELDFLPFNMPDFPANVAVFFTPVPDYGTQKLVDPEKAAAQIDRVKHPILRVLFANAAEDENRLEQEIEALLAEQEKSGRTDLRLSWLAASYFGAKKEDPKRALEILEKTRLLPMNRDLRRYTDAALVAYATAIDDRKPDDKISEIGKAAVLRLRYGRLSPQRRTEVVTALSDFGLESEAERLEKKGTAPAVASTMTYTSRSATAPQDVDDRIQKLMADGKKEPAEKLAIQTMRSAVKPVTSSTSGAVQIDYQVYNFMNFLKRTPALLKEVEADFKPTGENSKASDLIDYAVFLELTGDLNKAVEFYEKGLKAHGDRKKTGIEMRLTGILMMKDPEAAALRMAEIPEKSLPQFSTIMQSLGRQRDYVSRSDAVQVKGKINTAKAFTQWLAALDSEAIKKLDLTFLDYSVRNELSEQSYYNSDSYLPGMYTDINPRMSWQQTAAARKKLELLAKERSVAHEELCRAMIRSPFLARRAFSFLAGVELRDDFSNAIKSDDLKQLAESALQSAADKKSNTAARFTIYNQSIYNEVMSTWQPEQYLIVRAALNDDESATNDVIKLLEKTKDRLALTSAKKLREFVFAKTPDDFERNAEQFLKAAQSTLQPGYSGGGVTLRGEEAVFPEIVFAFWNHRKSQLSDLDFASFALDQADPASSAGTLLSIFYYRDLIDQNNSEEALSFLDDFTETILGKKAAWDKFKKAPQTRRPAPGGGYYSSGGDFTSPEHKLYAAVMKRLLFQPDTLFPVATFLWKNNLDDKAQVTAGTLLDSLDSPRFSEDPELSVALVKSSPFLGSVTEFTTGHGDNDNRFISALAHAKKNPAAKKRVLEIAGERDTFGAKLVTAYLSDGARGDVAKLLGEEKGDVLSKMPEETRADLAKFSRQFFGTDYERFSKLNDDTAAVFSAFSDIAEHEASRESEEFLAAKTLSDLNMSSDSEIERALEKLIPPLLRTKATWGKAEELFNHATALARREMKKGTNWSSYNTSAWTMESELLYDVVVGIPEGLEPIGFYERMIRSDKTGVFAITAGVQGFQNRIRKAFDEAGGDADFENAIETVASELSEFCPEGDNSQAGIYFKNFAFSLKPPQVVRLVKWADAQVEAGRNTALATEIAMTCRMDLMNSKRTEYTDAIRAQVPNIGAWKSHYLKVMQNENLALPWRLSIADVVCQANTELDRETVMLGAQLLEQVLAKDLPLNTWQVCAITREFNKLEQDNEWNQLAFDLHDGWMHKNRNNKKPRGSGLAFQPHESPIFNMLEMHLRLGDQGRIDTFLKEEYCASRIDDDARTTLLLVEAGQFEHARRFLEKGKSSQDLSDYQVFGNRYMARYTQKTADNQADFQASFKNPAMGYFGALITAGAMDPKANEKPKDSTFDTRGKRMVDLARTFKEIDFTSDPNLRERCLQQITTLVGSTGPVRTPLSKEYKPETLPDILRTTSSMSFRIRPWAALGAAQHERGEIGITRDFVKALKESTIDSYYKRQALEHFSRRVIESLKFRSPTAEEQELVAFYESLSLLAAADPSYANHDFRHQVLAAQIVVAALANRQSDHVEWAKNLPKGVADARMKILKTRSKAGWPIFTQVLKTKAPDPKMKADLAKRSKVLRVYSRVSGIRTAYGNVEDFFSPMLREKLISKDELLAETGAELVEAFPRGGLAAAELAGHFAAAEKFEEALKWSDRSFELGPKASDNPERFGKLVAAKGKVLLDADRKKEAATFLKTEADKLDQTKLTGATKGRLNALKKRAER